MEDDGWSDSLETSYLEKSKGLIQLLIELAETMCKRIDEWITRFKTCTLVERKQIGKIMIQLNGIAESMCTVIENWLDRIDNCIWVEKEQVHDVPFEIIEIYVISADGWRMRLRDINGM